MMADMKCCNKFVATRHNDEGCDITVVNNTGYPMVLTSMSAPAGIFIKGPPERINNGHLSVVRARGIEGFQTGCEFNFCYAVADADSTRVIWNFEKPFNGTNHFYVNCDDKTRQDYQVVESPRYVPSSHDFLTIITMIKVKGR